MTKPLSMSLFVAFVACGPTPVPPSPLLAAALSDPQLKVGVDVGAALSASAASIHFGKRSGTVAIEGAHAVRLEPVSGPMAFETWGPGVLKGSSMMYVAPHGRAALVETRTATGIKEDIVLTESIADAVRFTWRLELGNDLKAQLESEGSVSISGDDAQRLYTIPAPFIRDATGKHFTSSAQFELYTDATGQLLLTLAAEQLETLKYPISIDPSLIITTTADFGLGGNREDGVDINNATGTLVRGKQFGAIDLWRAGTATSVPRSSHCTIFYNNVTYLIGGEGNVTGPLLSDVYIAGATVMQATLPAPRKNHSCVAYNGYLYITGGTTTAAGTATTDVLFARINANGSLGPFVGTSSFGAPRQKHSAVAHEGRLYVTGGETLNTIEYAEFNADGTVSPFATTSNFATGRSGHVALASADNFYIVGGSNGNALADVQLARINANGSLGGFVTVANGLPSPRTNHGAVIYNNVMFVVGGQTGSTDLTETLSAQLNVDGTPGGFRKLQPLPAARHSHGLFASIGFLCVTGGMRGSTTLNDQQCAGINTESYLSPVATSATLPVGLQQHATVMHRGHVYMVGGLTNSGTRTATVTTAPLDGGALGAFVATTSLLGPRANLAAVANNGYLYAIGGFGTPADGGAVRYLDEVVVAPVNSDGSLGPFTLTTPMPRASERHGAFISNGALYVVAGWANGSPAVPAFRDVLRAPINANGTLGAFTTVGSLLTDAGAILSDGGIASGASGAATAVINDYLYVSGGFSQGTVIGGTQYAQLLSDGGLSAFAHTTSISPRYYHSAVGHDGNLFVFGGYTGSALNSVLVAPVNADGSLGAFTTIASLPAGKFGHSSVTESEFLYLFGGASAPGGASLNDVLSYEFGSAKKLGPMNAFAGPFPNRSHATVVTGGFLYQLGGVTPNPVMTAYRAAVDGDGLVSAFTATGSQLPSGRYQTCAATTPGRVYVAGGIGVDAGYQNDVWVALVRDGGVLGPFSSAGTLPLALAPVCFIENGAFYVVGGQTASATATNQTFVAPIQPDGRLGTFASGPLLSAAVREQSAFAYRGNIYVWGGIGSNDEVQIAPLNADGGFGPFTRSPTGFTRRGKAVAWNGYMYLIGGLSESDIQAAPILPTGALGTFTQVATLPGGGWTQGAVAVANGYLYMTGGYDGSNELPVVRVMKLPTTVGRYSKLIDLGSAAHPLSVELGQTPTNATTSLAYRVAPPSGVFGSRSRPVLIAPDAGVALAVDGGMRYLWLHFTLDDSNTHGANPNLGTPVDITDFTVQYNHQPLLTPDAGNLPPKGSQQFNCSLGSGLGYAYSINPNNSGATIDAVSGLYQAGAVGNSTDTVICTDSLGDTGSANVSIGPPLVAANAVVAPNTTATLTAMGGSGTGLTWQFVTNNTGATLSAAGAYVASSMRGMDTVRVTDSLGNTATAQVTVSEGVVLMPSSITLPPQGTTVFVALGGSDGGYVWSFQANDSGASLDGGAYRAGPNGNTMDVVKATDLAGNSGTATVLVSAGVSITSMGAVPPRGSQPQTATGGSGTGFTWTFVTNASGAALNGAVYTAGSLGGVTDVVRVTDSLSNTADRSITVSDGVSIMPANPAVAPLATLPLSAVGGSGAGYSWVLTANRSGGKLNESNGVYSAGGTANVVDEVLVIDSLGNRGTTLISVGVSVSIEPAEVTVAPRQVVQFTAVGGGGSNRWRLNSNNSGGTIDAMTGEYRAGDVGDRTDVIAVTDGLSEATATVRIGAALSTTPPAQRPPVNGWSCGCQSGGLGALTLGLLALAFRRRRSALNGGPLLVALLSAVSLGATPRTVAVLNVDVTVPNEKLDANAFTDVVVAAAASVPEWKVISSADIATMLGVERQKQLLGCNEDSSACVAELANALGSEFVMAGSVGRVGDNYLVTTKLISGAKAAVVGRSTIQTTSVNGLLEACWKSAQQTLDAYGASLPAAEAKAWSERPKPTPPAAVVVADSTPSQFGVVVTGSLGYQPLSDAGKRSSVGGEVDLSWRRGRFELLGGIVIAPSPGARVTGLWAPIDQRFRLDVGLQVTLFPGLGPLFGGGPTVGASFALTRIFALHARTSAEVYPTGGTVILALLGGLGASARF